MSNTPEVQIFNRVSQHTDEVATPEDTELFDLCQQVYKKTGWRDTDDVMCHGKKMQSGKIDTREVHEHFPLYTSDYLLEKLPTPLYIDKAPHQLQLIKTGDDFVAQYWFDDDNESKYEFGDTPLKALLQLTLALSEAGEL